MKREQTNILNALKKTESNINLSLPEHLMMLFVLVIRIQANIPDLEHYFRIFVETVAQNINVGSIHVEIL